VKAYFLFFFAMSGSGRIPAAELLLGMLPLELASISEPEDHATEYLHYRQFFSIWETLARVVECQSLEVQHMNKDTRAAWLRDYTVRPVLLTAFPFLC
jgi:nuclear pore complex protein Nup107